MSLKAIILNYYNQQLQDKEDVFRDMIANLTIDAQNDAKGSAGDKHETALSMMHLEQEKLNQKLHEIQQQKAILSRIDVSQNHNKIALGSIVKANNMLLFISAALPKITIDDKTIIAVSPQSPLGSKLMGNGVGFEFEIGNSKYTILEVY
jgi:transcription elongation GreA/GreB family factor